MSKIEWKTPQVVGQKRAGTGRGFRPFYQAAGLVALILTIGIAAQRSFDEAGEPQQSQYAQIDSMESPVEEFVAMPDQQEAALTVEQDSINLTR